MIKSLIIATTLFFAAPVFAQTEVVKKKEYKPFRYETPCQLETGNNIYEDTCVYLTWDNYNKREYKWDYQVGGNGWSYVMPGVLLENISWD
jgi:hypothetical protein